MQEIVPLRLFSLVEGYEHNKVCKLPPVSLFKMKCSEKLFQLGYICKSDMLCLPDSSMEVERPLGDRLDANQRMCFLPP